MPELVYEDGDMKKQKILCLITNELEKIHGRQVCDGIFTQCQKYGYRVAVFASMTEFSLYFKDILAGEIGVYKVPEFSKFEGVIIDSVTFVDDVGRDTMQELCGRLKDAKVPVVCIGKPERDFYTIENSNEKVLRLICRHVTQVHGCKKICLLTGPKGEHEAEERLHVLKDELARQGIEVPEEYAVYGDFWYSSGESLATAIVEGVIPRPEAIIATSDHMALGVIQKLTELGVRVPQDIIVAGFDITEQGMLDEIPVTSAYSNFAECAAQAVDYLISVLEPERKLEPYVSRNEKMLYIGKSCGCPYEPSGVMETVRAALYKTHHNYNRANFSESIDIGMLMENYIFERLTESSSPENCIKNIYESVYILIPYISFSLCLQEDWLEAAENRNGTHTDKMKLVLYRTEDEVDNILREEDARVFDRSEMLPRMLKSDEEPCVYYFSAIHFGGRDFGYAVLQRHLSDYRKFNLVYRNWLRFVSNALEMVRAKYQLAELSIRDKMTGLYNRRGMAISMENMFARAKENDRLFVAVVDMDGLKRINDTYGHTEGDYGIIKLSEAVRHWAKRDEICVRGGGDEFFVIGVSDYDEEKQEEYRDQFYQDLRSITAADNKPYQVTASLGWAYSAPGKYKEFEEVLSKADACMYEQKQQRKQITGIGDEGKR